jgi:cell division protein DivIC
MKTLREFFLPLIKNKYLLTLTVFMVWLIFFDNNNLVVRKRMLKEQRQLRGDCEYYRQRIVEDSTRLSELHKNTESLEKFAREQYLMKRDNEEIFVIVNK